MVTYLLGISWEFNELKSTGLVWNTQVGNNALWEGTMRRGCRLCVREKQLQKEGVNVFLISPCLTGQEDEKRVTGERKIKIGVWIIIYLCMYVCVKLQQWCACAFKDTSWKLRHSISSISVYSTFLQLLSLQYCLCFKDSQTSLRYKLVYV